MLKGKVKVENVVTSGLRTELRVLKICCALVFIFHGLAIISKRSQGALVDK